MSDPNNPLTPDSGSAQEPVIPDASVPAESVPAESVPAASIWSGDPAVAQPAVSPQPVTSSNAIVALVLGILSWPVCPVIFAIVALVFAAKADKEIAASGGRVGGSAFVLAAKLLSWINIGVFVAVLVLGLFAVLFLTVAGVASN